MLQEKTKILVVDDEQEVITILKKYLSVRGYEITNAYSGQEALRILEKEKIDIVILDIVMHGVSGGTVAKTINEKYPATKILVVTAHPTEGARLARETIVAGILIKPCGLEELCDKLQQLQSTCH
jgi:CheY-like chemotaxis protein